MNRRHQVWGWSWALVGMILVAAAAFAGDLNSPAAPSEVGSAMFTIEDLYNRLLSGTAGAQRSGGFAEPGAAPAGTMHNLNQIMEIAPAVDAAGAAPSEVLKGKKYWGLISGQWGLQTGSRCGGTVLKAGGSFSTGGRWYDNNDGTITDTVTGLVWAKNASTQLRYFVATATTDAIWYTTTLESGVGGLSDNSAQGDWRLPTRKELESLKTEPEPIKYLLVPSSAFGPIFTHNLSGTYFWTSTNYSTSIAETMVYSIPFDTALITPRTKNDSMATACVWAVRSKL